MRFEYLIIASTIAADPRIRKFFNPPTKEVDQSTIEKINAIKNSGSVSSFAAAEKYPINGYCYPGGNFYYKDSISTYPSWELQTTYQSQFDGKYAKDFVSKNEFSTDQLLDNYSDAYAVTPTKFNVGSVFNGDYLRYAILEQQLAEIVEESQPRSKTVTKTTDVHIELDVRRGDAVYIFEQVLYVDGLKFRTGTFATWDNAQGPQNSNYGSFSFEYRDARVTTCPVTWTVITPAPSPTPPTTTTTAAAPPPTTTTTISSPTPTYSSVPLPTGTVATISRNSEFNMLSTDNERYLGVYTLSSTREQDAWVNGDNEYRIGNGTVYENLINSYLIVNFEYSGSIQIEIEGTFDIEYNYDFLRIGYNDPLRNAQDEIESFSGTGEFSREFAIYNVGESIYTQFFIQFTSDGSVSRSGPKITKLTIRGA